MAREPEAITKLRRVLGGQLATFRQAAGLSQGQLAARLYCDRTTIAHMERGRSRGSTEFWQAADAAVGADGALVRGYGDVVAAQHAHETHTRETALAEVRARAEQLRDQQSTAPGEQRQQVARLGFAGYPFGGDGPVDSPSIAAIRAMAEAFQLADRRLGGGLLYGQVVRYIRVEIAPALLDPPRDIPPPDLFSAGASFAEVAGWMAHDGGHDDRAKAHFGQAYHLAAAARNPALSANICASLAHLAIQLGQADDAIRISTTGLPRASHEQGTGHLVARLHAMRARALALQGNEKECRRSLDAARDALGRVCNSSVVGWIAEFDQASLAAESALCLYSIGFLAEAETEARTVIALRVGDRVRSRALGQLTLASILYKAGQVAEAATIGADICGIASTLNSARVHSGLATLRNVLAGSRSIPEVGSFLDSVASLNQDQAVSHAEARWPL